MSTARRYDLGLVRALWRRDMLRLKRERSRWFGVVLQPLLFWLVIGSGIAPNYLAPTASGMGYLEFFYPGILVMVVLFTSIFATISVIEDRQSGFLQGVLVAPGSRLAMVVGKLSGVVSMTVVQSALFLALMPLTGLDVSNVYWPVLLFSIVLSSSSLTAVGICMAWVLPSAQAYHGVMSVLLLPLWLVSGAMFPPTGGAVEWIMRVNPMTYMVDAIRGAMTADQCSGVAPNMWVALLVTGAFCALSIAVALKVCQGNGARPK